MRIAILYSGGLDSRIMYHMAQTLYPDAQIDAFYFDHGAAYTDREIASLPDFVKVRKVEWLDDKIVPVAQPGRREGAIMIPGRNLVFGILLACQELPDEIWIGALHGETHAKGTDKNYIFLGHLNNTINYVLGPFRHGKPIVAKFPLADMKLNKLSAVQWALKNGLTAYDLLRTRSCHDGTTDRCGQCIQCIKRWAVFGACGFKEQYDHHPSQTKFGRKFIYDLVQCALGKDDYYDAETRAEMMPFLLYLAQCSPQSFEKETLAGLQELMTHEKSFSFPR